MTEKPINGTRGWSVLVVSVLASLTGSGSGVYVYMKNIGPDQLQTMARPDPATGTEMRILEKRVTYHLENHPDMVNFFDRRITRMETQLEIINEKLDRLQR